MSTLPDKTTITAILSTDPVDPAHANTPHDNLETNIDDLRTFLTDSTLGYFDITYTGTGLNFTVDAGNIVSAHDDQTITIVTSTPLVATAAVTNSVYLERNVSYGYDIKVISGTDVPAGAVKIWELTADATDITTMYDKRSHVTALHFLPRVTRVGAQDATLIDKWGTGYSALNVGHLFSIFSDYADGSTPDSHIGQNVYHDGTDYKAIRGVGSASDTSMFLHFDGTADEMIFMHNSSVTADTAFTPNRIFTINSTGVFAGINDSAVGVIGAFGGSATAGGELRLYNGGTADGSADYWNLKADSQDLLFRYDTTETGRIGSTGGMVWGSATGGDQGAGTINATTLYQNGIPVSGNVVILNDPIEITGITSATWNTVDDSTLNTAQAKIAIVKIYLYLHVNFAGGSNPSSSFYLKNPDVTGALTTQYMAARQITHADGDTDYYEESISTSMVALDANYDFDYYWQPSGGTQTAQLFIIGYVQ